jgi:hypothetical protein
MDGKGKRDSQDGAPAPLVQLPDLLDTVAVESLPFRERQSSRDAELDPVDFELGFVKVSATSRGFAVDLRILCWEVGLSLDLSLVSIEDSWLSRYHLPWSPLAPRSSQSDHG